jgi:2-methylcitrate dehydratase PrpD
MASAPATRRVVDFALGLRWDDVPDEVREQVLRCLRDLCGAGLGGSRTRVAQVVAENARWAYGAGPYTIVGRRGGSSPVGASVANGFAFSALDTDDGFRRFMNHPGSVVIPAVLAAAEETEAGGREFLTALVVGYEIAMRAAGAVHDAYGYYHGTGSSGALGAAAAAARLYGLDADRAAHAIGTADYHAPITPEMRSIDVPTMVKDGIGWGAMVGLASAGLARDGFTGIPSAFDASGVGRNLVATIGDEWLMPRLYFKPHCCCRWAQPAAEGALQALDELGIEADEVRRIRVFTFAAATRLAPTAPATTEEAQFSLPWPVACILLDGEIGPDQVLEPALGEPRRRELAARVEMLVDPELEAAYPERALARVELEAKDGRVAKTDVLQARGDWDLPLDDEELEQKLYRLAAPVVGEDGVDRLLRAIAGLPAAESVSSFAEALQADPVAAETAATA